jgi:hypothetical protein
VITDPLFYLVAIPAVTLLGLSKGGFSGIGAIGLPLMALVIPPVQAIAILIPILLTQDVVTIWSYRKKWDGRILRIMIPGQIAGVCIAWALATYVNDAAIRMVVGVITVLFTLNHWLGLGERAAARNPTPASGVAWGAVSGFTSFLANAGAPPFQLHVLPQKLEKETFVGTFSIFFACGNALKVVPYFLLGQLTPINMTTALALLPLAVATNIAGVWIVRRTPTEFFFRVIYVLMFLIGLELIRNGLMAMLK